MDTTFINSSNSETSNTHRLLVNLSDKINLKRSDIYVALPNPGIYFTWKNIKKKLYKNNKLKISVPTWNKEFELHNVSYSVSDIQNYFEYIIKKHKTFTDNLPVGIYVKNRKMIEDR